MLELRISSSSIVNTAEKGMSHGGKPKELKGDYEEEKAG